MRFYHTRKEKGRQAPILIAADNARIATAPDLRPEHAMVAVVFRRRSLMPSARGLRFAIVLFVHCAIWAFGISIVLIPLNLFAWWKVIMLLVGHFVIDYWKCHRLYLKKEHRLSDIGKSDYNALYLDQFLHFIQILLCLI